MYCTYSTLRPTARTNIRTIVVSGLHFGSEPSRSNRSFRNISRGSGREGEGWEEMGGSNLSRTRCRANIPRPQYEPRIRLGRRCLTKFARGDVDLVIDLCGQENFPWRMAYTTDRFQSKLHPPVRLQPRQPRRLQFVDEEGGLQTLALDLDETHPAGRTPRGSGDRDLPLARGVIGPRSGEVPANALSYKSGYLR